MRTATRLTARLIASLAPEATVYEQPDEQERGLRIVVQPSGHKSYAVRFWNKLEGKRDKIVLGSAADLSLADARSLTSDIRSANAKHENPQAVSLSGSPLLSATSLAVVTL